MRCISRLITLLGSAVCLVASEPGACIVVDGARIMAGDLTASIPAFLALPADKDLGPAPAGTLVRTYSKVQLAALLPGTAAELPNRICVQRRRDAIPPEVWQAAVDAAMNRLCDSAPWKATVVEAPRHRFPLGELVFNRAGLIASRGSVQLWRGALHLPDKSSAPVWVRVEIQSQRRAVVMQRAVAAGGTIGVEDYREEEIWAPGPCAAAGEAVKPEGMVAKRTLAQGAVLGGEDLRRAPAVRRGEPVELQASAGATRLRVPTVAEHDAEVGDNVQLKSSWNGTKLVGRVTGTQKARVE